MTTESSLADLERGKSEGSSTDNATERPREEAIALVTGSVAAVASAWAAFQSATWSGKQTFALAPAAIAGLDADQLAFDRLTRSGAVFRKADEEPRVVVELDVVRTLGRASKTGVFS